MTFLFSWYFSHILRNCFRRPFSAICTNIHLVIVHNDGFFSLPKGPIIRFGTVSINIYTAL